MLEVMKGGIEMNFFTAEEALKIVSGASLRFCTGYDDNPNRDAFEECVRFAGEVWCSKRGYASYGFLLGYATGIRAERARRAGERSYKEK